MKMKYFLVGLLLVPSLVTSVAAQTRMDPHQAYGIEEGREVAAPSWSFACMNDQGPQQCDEPMWVYGSPDYLAQFKNAF